IAASVPVYLLLLSAAVVQSWSVPQSVMTRLSLPAIGLVVSLLVRALRVSEKAPMTEPVFLMTTVPLVAGSPGFMFEAVRIAAPTFELVMLSVPAVKVLLGFAVCAVKLAPDATVTPTATRMVARAASRRRGLARRTLVRDIGIAPDGA